MTEKIKCSKCNALMVEGFIPDFNHTDIRVLNWVWGAPQTGILGRTKVKKDEMKSFQIKAFRCSSCGFIELNARDPQKIL